MKKYLIIIALLYVQNLWAQTGIVHTAVANPSISKHTTMQLYYSKDNQGNYVYQSTSYISGGYSIGFSESVTEYAKYYYYYRSAWQINLPSIPSNATNITATLTIKVDATDSRTGKIIALDDNQNMDYLGGLYAAIDNGSELFEYDFNQVMGYTEDITSFYLSKKALGYFKIGTKASNSYPQFITSVLLEITYSVPAQISFQNNMGGPVYVNNVSKSPGFSDYYWLNTNVSLYVDEPQSTQSPNYTWIWNDSEAPLNSSNWTRTKNGEVPMSPSQSYSFSVTSSDDASIYRANLRKKCDVTVSSSNYPIYINGTAYYSSTAISVVEGNQFNPSLQCDPIFSQNGQMQFFSHWNINGSPLYPNVLINAHSSVNPVYVNRPVYNGYKQVFYGQTVGQPIEVYWTENPNTQITEYEIWRRVKSNGVLGPETKIATVGRGVQLHTDYAYNLTDGYSDKLILYDVREHNTVTGGYSSPAYEAVFGTTGDLSKKAIKDQIASNEVPTEYSIGNYPNPFNPTTTINYQLPKDGVVTIKVYDIIGKEVATLVNGHKSAGYYKVDFDASKLTSGVYICSIQASSFNKSIKLLLTK